MKGPGRDKDLVADLLVFVAAALVMALALLPRMTDEQAPANAVSSRPDPALVREIELSAISLTASELLPADVQSQIGLTGEPLATRKGVLEDLAQRLRVLTPSPDLELVRISLAAAWREDDLALRALHAFDEDIKPKRAEDTAAYTAVLERTTPARKALGLLISGRPAPDIAVLENYLRGVGASHWLIGLVKTRHLANANDPAHTALGSEMGEIAQSVALRHALFFGLGIGLIVFGTLLFIIFPGFIRPRLLARGLAQPLPTPPFLLERTRRVVLGWFAGAYLSGTIVAYLAASFGAPGFAPPLAGLCSGLIAVLLIRHWGLAPTFHASLAQALTLAGPARADAPRIGLPKRLLVLVFGTVAALAVTVAVTWFFETLNYTLVGPPETQQSIKQLMANGDTLALVLMGLSAVVIAPVVEEIVFRGFLFRNLRETVGKPLAVVLSGFVFALVHMHPTLILPLTGFGIALALLYEWTGSLWVPILAHMAFNLLTLVRIEAIWRI